MSRRRSDDRLAELDRLIADELADGTPPGQVALALAEVAADILSDLPQGPVRAAVRMQMQRRIAQLGERAMSTAVGDGP